MIVQATRELPILSDLLQELKNEFSDQYTFKIFGLGSQRSILVRKSAWIGVQITIRNRGFFIDGSFPNLLASSFMTLLSQSTIAPVNKWVELEKKIADFLKRKYSR